MIDFLETMIEAVAGSVIHNAPYLALGILIAAAITVYVNPEKLRRFLIGHSSASVPGAVAFGALTPLCACGSMAVVISMLTTALPWGPIMAFLTSSPLMSPDGFVMIAGIVSVKFATALAVSSVVIGLASGYLTHLLETRTGFLAGQARFGEKRAASAAAPCGCRTNGQAVLESAPAACGCSSEEAPVGNPVPAACGCGTGALQPVMASAVCCGTPSAAAATVRSESSSGTGNRFREAGEAVMTELRQLPVRLKVRELGRAVIDVGFRQVLPYFVLFAAIGWLINRFVPAELIVRFLGKGNVFAVPVLALAGLPLYVTGSSALPVINALLAGGASGGALLAFLITGPGTSAGVIAGLAVIMKRRAIALYTAYLLVFAVVLGYLYDLILAFAG